MKILKTVTDDDLNVIKCPDCGTVFSITSRDLKRSLDGEYIYVTCPKKTKKVKCSKNFKILFLEQEKIPKKNPPFEHYGRF